MPIPKLRFKDNQGRDYPDKIVKRIESLILEYKEKVDANSNLPILTSSKQFGIEFQEDHFAGKQRHDIEGYNVLPRNYCTYRNRSDGLDFKFNINTICEKGIISKFYPVFKGNNCNLYFLKTLLNNDPATLRKIAYTAKGTSQKVLSITDLKKITVTIPTLPEQEKIADFLSNYDRMIDVQSQRVEAMKTRKKGLLQKIFSQEIRFKNDNGQNYPEWEKKTVGSLANNIVGGGTPSTKNPAFYAGEIPWISSSDLVEDKINYLNMTRFITQDAINRSATKLIPAQSVMIVCRVGVGKVAVNELPLCTSQDFMNLIVKEENSPVFIGYLLMNLMVKRRNSVQGTAIKGIPSAEIKKFKVLVPALPEQQKIADFLTTVDAQIDVEEKRLEIMKTIKKGLLQQMFI